MGKIIGRGEATEEHKKKITRRRRARRDAQRKERERQIPRFARDDGRVCWGSVSDSATHQ